MILKPGVLSFKSFPPNFGASTLLQKMSYFLSTGFCLGHLPASGTWGALLAWAIHTFLFPHAFTLSNWKLACAALASVTIIGIFCADNTEKLLGKKDASRINIDEVAGYCMAVMFAPAGIAYTIPAFLLCRLFDIIKPPPACQLESVGGGLGIMIDDLIASVYACLILHGLIWLGWPFWK